MTTPLRTVLVFMATPAQAECFDAVLLSPPGLCLRADRPLEFLPLVAPTTVSLIAPTGVRPIAPTTDGTIAPTNAGTDHTDKPPWPPYVSWEISW